MGIACEDVKLRQVLCLPDWACFASVLCLLLTIPTFEGLLPKLMCICRG